VCQWDYTTAVGSVADDSWHTIELVHDGTSPSVVVDGASLALTGVDTTDPTAWWAGYSELAMSLGTTLSYGPYSDIEYLAVTSEDEATIHARLEIVGGATIRETVSEVDATVDDDCTIVYERPQTHYLFRTDPLGVIREYAQPDLFALECADGYALVENLGAAPGTTSGEIAILWRRCSNADNGGLYVEICELTGDNSNERILVQFMPGTGYNFFWISVINGTGASNWYAYVTPVDTITDDEWHALLIAHDGAALEFSIDGTAIVLSRFDFGLSDETKWWADWSTFGSLKVGEAHASGPYYWVGSIIVRPYGGGTAHLKTSFPDSSSMQEDVSGKAFAITAPAQVVADTTAATAPGEYIGGRDPVPVVPERIDLTAIAVELLSRGYVFGAPDREKRIGMGEVAFSHRNPQLDATLVAEGANEETSVFSDQEYDQDTYDIHGADDWDGSGATHDDPHRQDYAPLELEAAGISIPDAGITLDMEQVHTRKFHAGIVTRRAQLRLANDQGTVGIREIRLTGTTRAAGRRQ